MGLIDESKLQRNLVDRRVRSHEKLCGPGHSPLLEILPNRAAKGRAECSREVGRIQIRVFGQLSQRQRTSVLFIQTVTHATKLARRLVSPRRRR